MPFRYVIKWRRTHPERVSVEAYHRYPTTQEEKHKPAFIIGRAQGSGVLAIRHVLEKAAKKNPTRRYGNTTHVLLGHNDETAYRIGLAAALIDKAETAKEIEKGTKYILTATPEEVWFWTSKWLDDDINERALEALAVISGSTYPNKLHHELLTEAKPKVIHEKPGGSFWPIVRQRMKEKALQLYMKEHPETNTQPEIRELKEAGYMQKAKALVLREISKEKKAKST